jgi:hypothetical protein
VEILEKRELLDSTPNQAYVAQVYQDLLLRGTDAAGLAFWSGQLDKGASRSIIADSLDHSAEYFQTNIIKPGYQQFLNRTSDQAGLDFWTGQLQGGLTDEQMQAGFIASNEFYANANHGTVPVPVTPAHDRAWVDALYQALLKRAPDQAGEDFWTNELQGTLTRLQVANGFTGSTEGLGLRVLQTYQRYLHRSAMPAEVNFWVGLYHAGFTNEGIVTGFISSNEYYANAQLGLSITSPANGLSTKTNVSVTGQYSDTNSTITSLQAQVDSGTPSSATFDTAGHFSFTTTLALDGSADGNHTVHFQATDQAGKTASTAVSFKLDTRPPVVASNSPAPGVTTSTNITITGTVSDAGSGVAGLQAKVDNGAAAAVTVGAGGSFTFATSLALDGSANGAHTVHFTATDAVGNSGGLVFPFTLQVSTGGGNHAPTLQPIAPLTVMPGGYLAVPLQASDQDGDRLTFTVGGASPPPTGQLTADGTLIFTPTTAEIGTYNFTVYVSDGQAEASQPVTLHVVADPVTTTRVSGVVKDFNDLPIAGVTVAAGGSTTTTASDGSYHLTLASASSASTLEVRGANLGGQYTTVSTPLARELQHGLYTGNDNVIGRSTYLTVVDSAHAVTVDPLQPTVLTSPSVSGFRLSVPAGGIVKADGTPYSGPLSITAVPAKRLSVAQTSSLSPAQTLQLAPQGAMMKPGGLLSLPNAGNLPPNSPAELNERDPATGELEPVGPATVSPDGTTVDYTGPLDFFGDFAITPQVTSYPGDPGPMDKL